MSKKMQAGWSRINAEDFESLKQSITLLINSGLTNQATATALKRSAATISMVKRSDTYEDYRALVNRYIDNSKKLAQDRKNGVAPTVQVEDTDKSQPEEPQAEVSVPQAPANELALAIDELRLAMTSQMQAQTAALNRLADAWESTPKKKGFF